MHEVVPKSSHDQAPTFARRHRTPDQYKILEEAAKKMQQQRGGAECGRWNSIMGNITCRNSCVHSLPQGCLFQNCTFPYLYKVNHHEILH